MKTPYLPRVAAALFCLGVANIATALNERESVVTAVFSRSFNNYSRAVQADGTPVIQTYVVAKGGYNPGLGEDPSIEDVKFAGIVRVLGQYLANEGYFPAKDPKKADVMLVVHWGRTTVGDGGTQRRLLTDGISSMQLMQQFGAGIGTNPSFDGHTPRNLNPVMISHYHVAHQDESLARWDAQRTPEVAAALAEEATEQMVQGMFQIRIAEQMRYGTTRHNANLLGYTGELNARDNPSLYAGAGTSYHDLLDDVESERYYVAVTAYDFQEALKHNHKQGLWRTVASIDARGNRFDEKLMAMVEKASRYFGRDSGRLIRRFEYTPHVSFGELKILGVVEKEPASKK